jgi:two-component system, sensor histidine kinase
LSKNSQNTVTNKGTSNGTSKAFVVISIVLGVILACSVLFIYAYIAKSRGDAQLATGIEYIKRQYSYYIEYNNTEEAKSLIRKVETSSLLDEYQEGITPEHLQLKTEESAATGIAVLDENNNVTVEYSQDEITYETFRHEFNEDIIQNVMQHDNNVYMNRITLDDDSCVDIAIQEYGPGTVVVYKHTTREFAVKSILSIQNILDGYDPEQNGTIVITDGANIVASNDRSLLEDAISEENYKLIYDIRNSGHADTMLTVEKESENQHYFGRYSHGSEFYICAFMSERQIYSSAIPVVGLVIILYVFAVVGLQFMKMKSTNKLILSQKEQEQMYQRELENKNAELTKAVNKAEAASRSKQDFLFNMSHDIRTPMNAIIGFTDLAEQNINDAEKTHTYLTKIMTSSKHLLSLINDVLDMSRIENGKVNIEAFPVCITEQLQLMKDVVQSEVEANNLTYVEKTENVEDVYIYADALHVNRVLMNILGNAVKFTPAGGTITFTVRERESARHGYGLYDFIIEDTGIGMSEEFVGRIFEQFAREKSSTVSRTQGTGLGMSITKSLVDLMGGTIEVESKLGHGSKFTVTFEFMLTTKDVVQRNMEEQDINSSVDLAGKKVLLVEDNELNMEIAIAILEAAGFEIETAEDGSEALNKVDEQPAGYYDVILMDIQMPMMNGYETTRAIRMLDNQEKANVPIIAMTANAFDEDKKNAKAAGMNAHISKPINVADLMQTIENVLNDAERNM